MTIKESIETLMNDPFNNSNLIWLDLEMTGLDTQNDAIIEIATVVTDKDLNVLAEGPVLAIHQPIDLSLIHI